MFQTESNSDQITICDPSLEGKKVIVVGSGYAAIAAVMRLINMGCDLHWVQTSRTATIGPAGEEVDYSHHVLLRACTNQLDLLNRLGLHRDVQWSEFIQIVRPCSSLLHEDQEKKTSRLSLDDLPPPLHMIRGVVGLHCLPPLQRLRVLSGLLSLIQVSIDSRGLQSGRTFGQWLRSQGQTDETIRCFFAPLLSLVCHEDPDAIDASFGIRVMQEGFLFDRRAGQMGSIELHHSYLRDVATQHVTSAGGKVYFEAKVAGLQHEDARISGLVMQDGEVLEADAFIMAVTHSELKGWVTPEQKSYDRRLASLDKIHPAYVCGVHYYLREPPELITEHDQHGDVVHGLMPCRHMVVADSDLVRFIYDRGYVSRGKYRGLHHIHVVLMPGVADEWRDMPDAHLAEEVSSQMETLLVGWNECDVEATNVLHGETASTKPLSDVDGEVVRWSHGEFENFYLSGDWCASGWPTTRESAVRSGYVAARVCQSWLLTGEFKNTRQLLAPSFRPGPMYQVVGG